LNKDKIFFPEFSDFFWWGLFVAETTIAIKKKPK